MPPKPKAVLQIDGIQMTAAEAAAHLGVAVQTIWSRIRRGTDQENLTKSLVQKAPTAYNRICPACNRRTLQPDRTADWIEIKRCATCPKLRVGYSVDSLLAKQAAQKRWRGAKK